MAFLCLHLPGKFFLTLRLFFQATAQDPVFQKMKTQFTSDFDFSVPGSKRLHNVIQKLKKWIKILEAKTKVGRL